MKPTNRSETIAKSVELFRAEIEVDPSLTANAYQHVHHADALRLLEHARHRYLESKGLSLAHFLDRGLLLMVSRVDLRYRREVRQGSVVVTVECPAVDMRDGTTKGATPPRQFLLEQRILVRDSAVGTPGFGSERVAVQASIWQVFVSAELMRSIAPPEDLRSLFGLSSSACDDTAPSQ
jgi:acyl-CoA thioesterase FadM